MSSDLIYHHTTTDGLIGIVSNASIWATDIEFLNDYAEFKAGLEELTRACMECSNSAAPELHGAYTAIEELIRDNLTRRRLYVSSFTKTRDDLRQWMSYGRPNASYCVAFDKTILSENCGDSASENNDAVYKFTDVDYSKTALTALLNPETIRENIMKMRTEKGSPGILFMPLINDLMFATCSIKNNEFRDEKETRLIYSTRAADDIDRATKFRSSGGMIVPYVPVKIPTRAIKEVIIGPSVDNALSRQGVKQLLLHHGVKAEISHTGTSLRQF